jgi:hypothetical protein
MQQYTCAILPKKEVEGGNLFCGVDPEPVDILRHFCSKIARVDELASQNARSSLLSGLCNKYKNNNDKYVSSTTTVVRYFPCSTAPKKITFVWL